MINQYNCAAAGSNTGIGDCPLMIDKIAGAILVWKNFSLSANDLASDAALQAALIAAAAADVKAERVFPVGNFVDITDNSSDPEQQTFGYGPVVNTSDGIVNWSFPFLKGGFCLLKALQSFNGSDIRVLFYDASGTLFGWKVGDTLKGIPLIQFVAPAWKAPTGNTVMDTRVNFSFLPRYVNKELGFYKTSEFSLDSIEGLQNVNIRQTGVQAKPVYKVKVTTGCSGIDLFDQYSAELADDAMWVAKNKATGGSITITSVAVDPAIAGFTITLDATGAYPAVGSIELNLAAVSVLTAAGITGLEGVPLTIVNAA